MVNKKISRLIEDLTTPSTNFAIYRTLPHPTATEYVFLSTAHGIFTNTDYKLGYKTSLNKCKQGNHKDPIIL